jgi:hypothetical protein
VHKPIVLSIWLAVLSLVLAACGSEAISTDFVDVPGVGVTRLDVPRPSSEGGGDCTLAFDTDEPLAERVAALRAIGLFADREALSDAALTDELEAAIEETWGEVPADDPLFELLLAEMDRSRAWWRDLEADVVDGNDVYVTTIQELSAISEGAFAPSSVSESWSSEMGPITVSFELGGESHQLEPAYLEDWIDPRILGPINDLIRPAGRRFEIVAAFDQTAFVLALTPDERLALEGRGWCFE